MFEEIFTNLIGHAIVAAGRAIKMHNLKLYDENNFEITPEQYLVLNMINESGNYNQNRICKLLYKDKSNMARLVGILEKKELISKVQNGQINSIIITPKGRQLRDLITPLMNNSRKNYLKDIPEDDMYTCIKVLNTIQKNLENEHDNKKGQE